MKKNMGKCLFCKKEKSLADMAELTFDNRTEFACPKHANVIQEHIKWCKANNVEPKEFNKENFNGK
jgi:hypothetical protein